MPWETWWAAIDGRNCWDIGVWWKETEEQKFLSTHLSWLSDSTGRIYYQHIIWLCFRWAINIDHILSPYIKCSNKGTISIDDAWIRARRIVQSTRYLVSVRARYCFFGRVDTNNLSLPSSYCRRLGTLAFAGVYYQKQWNISIHSATMPSRKEEWRLTYSSVSYLLFVWFALFVLAVLMLYAHSPLPQPPPSHLTSLVVLAPKNPKDQAIFHNQSALCHKTTPSDSEHRLTDTKVNWPVILTTPNVVMESFPRTIRRGSWPGSLMMFLPSRTAFSGSRKPHRKSPHFANACYTLRHWQVMRRQHTGTLCTETAW